MEGTDGTKKVFVGNLAWSTTDDELFEFAAQSGEVQSAVVQRHEDTGRSKGWGLVEYANAAAASDAVRRLDGGELKDRKVHVRYDRTEMERAAGPAIFVGNLPWSTTDEELMELFAEYHPVSCTVMKNMAGRSRGFAIARFNDTNRAESAIAGMNGYELSGRTLEVRLDHGPGRAAVKEKRSLFVGNLSDAATDKTLRSLFDGIGTIVSARVQKRPNGESKGWGLVEFSTTEQAAQACERMNGFVLDDRALDVRYDDK